MAVKKHANAVTAAQTPKIGKRSAVLHNISACRGAMDALMAEVIEGHPLSCS
jgi:hypothetical protein